MSFFTNNDNLSILATPAYFILAMIPCGRALNIASQGSITTWDNCDLRNTDLKPKLKT